MRGGTLAMALALASSEPAAAEQFGAPTSLDVAGGPLGEVRAPAVACVQGQGCVVIASQVDQACRTARKVNGTAWTPLEVFHLGPCIRPSVACSGGRCAAVWMGGRDWSASLSTDLGLDWTTAVLQDSRDPAQPGTWSAACHEQACLVAAQDDDDNAERHKVWLTLDNGESWTRPQDLRGDWQQVGDISLTCAPSGEQCTAALVGLSEETDGIGGNAHELIFTTVTTDGGLTWSRATAVPFSDQQQGLLTATSGFSRTRELRIACPDVTFCALVSAMRVEAQGNLSNVTIEMAFSTDGGASFKQPQTLESGTVAGSPDVSCIPSSRSCMFAWQMSNVVYYAASIGVAENATALAVSPRALESTPPADGREQGGVAISCTRDACSAVFHMVDGPGLPELIWESSRPVADLLPADGNEPSQAPTQQPTQVPTHAPSQVLPMTDPGTGSGVDGGTGSDRDDAGPNVALVSASSVTAILLASAALFALWRSRRADVEGEARRLSGVVVLKPDECSAEAAEVQPRSLVPWSLRSSVMFAFRPSSRPRPGTLALGPDV